MDQTGYRLAYACQSCGLLAEAQITEHGRRRSRRAAQRTLALSPCPDCGWRDPKTARRFAIGAVVKVLLAALIPLALAVFAGVYGQPSLALSAVVAAGVAGWACYMTRIRPQAHVAHRVRFLSSGEVALRSRVSSRKMKARERTSGRTTSSRLRAVADSARSRSASH